MATRADISQASFRNRLRKELQFRLRANPRYSLRAFARDLEIAPGRLSEILSRKQGISNIKARGVCKKLRLTPAETEVFLASVDLECARNQIVKDQARVQLEAYLQRHQSPLTEHEFRLIQEWHHFAILEVLSLPGASADPESIARRLGITLEEVNESFSRLKALGLVHFSDSGPIVNSEYTSSSTEIPSLSIRNFHLSILEKSKQSLAIDDVAERDFSSVTFSIDPADLSEFKQYIKKFRRTVVKKLPAKSKSRVYALNIQLIPLDRGALA